MNTRLILARNIDLVLAAAWAVVTTAVVLLVPSLGPARVVLGLPFVLFLPGYVLVAALYPRWSELEAIERVGLSFGLSLAVVPFVGLALNYSPWGVRLDPVLGSLALFVVAGAAAATYRRQTLLPEEALVVAARPSLPPWPRIGWASAALALIVVISMAGIGAAAYFVGTSRGNPERFTEFYVLGPGGRADGYPATLELGQGLTVTLGIVSHEGRSATYRLEARIDGRSVDSMDGLTLGPGQRWEKTVTLVPNRVGKSQKVDFGLYKDGANGVYRNVHLWLDVESAPSQAAVGEGPPQVEALATPHPTATPPLAPPPLRAGPGGLVYVVEPGSTLTEIGERFDLSPEAIAAANGMPEPGPIVAGQELAIPGTTYVVQAGDTLTTIAAAFGVSPAVIMEANGIGDPSALYAGQEVAIPGASP
ncbi:MAG: DUF1616 domain-containing protein [Chloroflexota bacterium]|nr:DUF1616 domain-containing protein [Chloroflexota bacterium]